HIGNVVYIDRGYENMDAKLRSLGASIARVEENEHPCPQNDCEEPVDWTLHPLDDAAS
ncbi:MAG: hypothetical protein GX620_08065, partial [Chloroflexi bacterium]|nr:hypothetical protein [Chloroflexota bacterium]